MRSVSVMRFNESAVPAPVAQVLIHRLSQESVECSSRLKGKFIENISAVVTQSFCADTNKGVIAE